jgi:hypothetical protein
LVHFFFLGRNATLGVKTQGKTILLGEGRWIN